MNILFNKKILFSLLLSSSLLIQGAYAQNDPSTEISGTLNILPTSSLDTPVLNIPADGSVTVGNEDLPDGFGVVDINDANNDDHNTKSEIKGTLNIEKDGNFLNEEEMHLCTTKNSDNTNNGNQSILNNGGLFINQKTLIVENGATLTCGIFPTSSDAWKYTDPDSGTEETVPYYANYVGIMNGSCPFNATKTPTFMYSYKSTNNTASINIDNKDDSNKYPDDKSGTINFFPGASCNDGNPQGNPAVEGQGEIDGGIIDLTKYVKIQTNNNATSNGTETKDTDQYSLQFDTNSTKDKAKDLKINIKNAEIKLFTDNNIKNAGNYTVNKTELSQLKLNENFGVFGTTNDVNMQNMFANLTFENCICEIPKDEGSGTVAYNFSEKIITFNADADNRYKVGSSGSGGSNNNFNVVKKLFKSDGDPSYRIYHGIGEIGDDGYFSAGYTNYDCDTTISKDNYKSDITTPNKGLVLYGSGDGDSAGGKDTFSELFNKCMNLNCYVDLSEVTNVVSDDITSKKLDLVLKTPTSHNTNDKYTYDIFIQLANNVTGFTNSDIVINKQTSNFADTNPTTADFDGTLELVMKNPWIHTSNGLPTYKGTLSRALPNLTSETDDEKKAKRTTKIVQEYDGQAFNNFKINHNTFGMNADTLSSTKKDNLTSSDILEYEVVSNNPTNDNIPYNKFSANQLVADKFTIGKAGATKTFTVSSDNETQSSNILTQNFTVNDKATYNLKGHITVRNLKGGDFL